MTTNIQLAETFQILHGFPQEIIEELRAIWENEEYDVTKEVVPSKFWHYQLTDKNHPVYRHFEHFQMIEYYKVAPGFRNSPHLDRGRWAAINIPIEVDLENSYFYTGKHIWLGNYEWDPEKNDTNSYLHDASEHGPKGFYRLTEDQAIKYNLEKPVIFNTKVPHGGNNVNASTMRTIVSVGVTNKKYEEIINLLPREWFMNVD